MPNVKKFINAECEKFPDSAIELKYDCIRLVENKSKNENCKLKELLQDCMAFISTKKRLNCCLNLNS
uniref:Uncharacterized protein n=1 Tax=Meloidogyne enterolobii TaxID=390850 RepID=A0A6V7V880_MELEN|nr:unnamed protein product [Meloidogyne enterolobii]